MKNIILATLLLIIITGSCKKGENALSVNQIFLTKSSWRLIEHVERVGNGQPIDQFPNYEPCELDNITIYKTDGSYIITEGATKCNLNGPDTVAMGSWKLLAENTDIIFDNASSYKIEKLDEESLIFFNNVVNGNGETVYTRYTYVH